MSTQHSSPRSDAASGLSTAAPPPVAPPLEGGGLQTSDVIIHRKENEGFGFVIISSLNRPENAAIISESQHISVIQLFYEKLLLLEIEYTF